MGQGSTETVKEIAKIRGRMEGGIRELEERLPSGAWVKRFIGVAVGGGVGGSIFFFALRRFRRRKKEHAVTPAVVQVLPDDLAEKISEKLEDDRWKQWAAAIGGVWLLFRLAELRQLRKVNRARA